MARFKNFSDEELAKVAYLCLTLPSSYGNWLSDLAENDTANSVFWNHIKRKVKAMEFHKSSWVPFGDDDDEIFEDILSDIRYDKEDHLETAKFVGMDLVIQMLVSKFRG